MQAHVNFPLGGGKDSLDSALQDHVEMAPDRPLIEKDLSRGNASAHAHPRKPGNLLAIEFGVKLVGQFVREFRFVYPDRLWSDAFDICDPRGSSMLEARRSRKKGRR